MKIAVFWVVAPCSLVEVYQRFRGPCCLHHQGDETTHLHTHRRENLKSYLIICMFAFPIVFFVHLLHLYNGHDIYTNKTNSRDI
jgi:hypothetical protein